MNYYNEIEPAAAAWLRELIKGGHIADGIVDERSIKDVTPEDLKGFTQCHFFAGIGVWPYALAQAGWPEDRPVWTGSCPCQPFSVAGRGARTTDARHLWPAWFGLIQKRRPDTIFGEQVATEAGRVWLDIVGVDLEREDYAVGACSTNAVYFGAPHRRQRTYFVGHADGGRSVVVPKGGRRKNGHTGARVQEAPVADAAGIGLEGAELLRQRDSVWELRRDRRVAAKGRSGDRAQAPAKGWNPKRPWDECEWLDFENPWTKKTCQRPVEPGTLPLAYGSPSGVVRIRGYGNALCAPQAIGFIEAFVEISRC